MSHQIHCKYLESREHNTNSGATYESYKAFPNINTKSLISILSKIRKCRYLPLF